MQLAPVGYFANVYEHTYVRPLSKQHRSTLGTPLTLAGIDPGYRNPCVYAIGSLFTCGRLHVHTLREFTETTMDDILLRMLAEGEEPIARLGCDHASRQRHMPTGRSCWDEFREHGLRPHYARETLSQSLSNLRYALNNPRDGLYITIDPSLVRVREALRSYAVTWNAKPPHTVYPHWAAHVVDSLRYLHVAARVERRASVYSTRAAFRR